MKEKFYGTFRGKKQKNKSGAIVQSTLELGELGCDEIRDALEKIIENKMDWEILDFILYDMFDLLNHKEREELIEQHFKEFKLAFADKIQEKDEQLAEDIKNGEYDD